MTHPDLSRCFCPYCGGSVVARAPQVHKTTRGKPSVPRFGRPRAVFLCLGCKRVLRKVRVRPTADMKPKQAPESAPNPDPHLEST